MAYYYGCSACNNKHRDRDSKKCKPKVRKPKLKVGQVVYDRAAGYCDYVRVKSLKDWPLVWLIDSGGNQWTSHKKHVRALSAKEKGL